MEKIPQNVCVGPGNAQVGMPTMVVPSTGVVYVERPRGLFDFGSQVPYYGNTGYYNGYNGYNGYY